MVGERIVGEMAKKRKVLNERFWPKAGIRRLHLNVSKIFLQKLKEGRKHEL